MRTSIVLDASAAVRLIVGPSPAGIATGLAVADEVFAPRLFTEEVANTLWKYVQAGVFDSKEAINRLRTALALCDHFLDLNPHSSDSLLIEALTEACRLNHPVYDLIYLVAARRTGATLATCDQRLATMANSQGIEVLS